MASRAHVVYDYPISREHWPQREVWYRNDEPVVLPRTSAFRLSGGLILAALTAGALLAGSAYSVLYTPPPPLAETPIASLTRDYTVDTQVERANVTNQLSGPALAVPQTGEAVGAEEQDVPMFGSDSRDHEVFIDDSAPGAQPRMPQTSPAMPPPQAPKLPQAEPSAPYPNPTITPPEGIAPDPASPQTPTPALDPQNPYRD